MPRNVAVFRAKTRQRLCNLANDAVARFVAVCVIDRLELVDVAKGHAQRLARVLRLEIGCFQNFFEGPAIGQPCEIIDLRIVPSAVQILTQLGRFALARFQLFLGLARPRDHRLGKIRERGDQLCSVARPLQVIDPPLKLVAIVGGRPAHRRGRARQLVDPALHILRQVLYRFLASKRVDRGHLFEPCLGDRFALFATPLDPACQSWIDARTGFMRRKQVGRSDLKITLDQEVADFVQQPTTRTRIELRRCRHFGVFCHQTRPPQARQPDSLQQGRYRLVRLYRRVRRHAPLWREEALIDANRTKNFYPFWNGHLDKTERSRAVSRTISCVRITYPCGAARRAGNRSRSRRSGPRQPTRRPAPPTGSARSRGTRRPGSACPARSAAAWSSTWRAC